MSKSNLDFEIDLSNANVESVLKYLTKENLKKTQEIQKLKAANNIIVLFILVFLTMPLYFHMLTYKNYNQSVVSIESE